MADPEQIARDKIDAQLRSSGWAIQNKGDWNHTEGIGQVYFDELLDRIREIRASEAGNLMAMRDRATVGAWAGPFDFAGRVGLLFPDGDACFDRVDEVAVCLKGGFPVRRAGQGNNRAFTDGKSANTVDRNGLGDGEFFHRFREDALAFLLRENRVVGVVKLGDIAAFMVITNEALEKDESSAGGILHLAAKSGDIERCFLNLKHDNLTSGKRRHEGNGLTGFKEIGPGCEFVI